MWNTELIPFYIKKTSLLFETWEAGLEQSAGIPGAVGLGSNKQILTSAPCSQTPGWTWPLGVQIRAKVTAILPLPPRGHLHVSCLPPPWTALCAGAEARNPLPPADLGSVRSVQHVPP